MISEKFISLSRYAIAR